MKIHFNNKMIFPLDFKEQLNEERQNLMNDEQPLISIKA